MPVRQTRKNPILMLLALALIVFAPKEIERVRGGFAVGSVPAFNCVHALFPALEIEFATPARPHSHAAFRPVARGGALVEMAYQTCLARGWSFSVPVFHPLSLPHGPVSAALPPARCTGCRREIRGPPLPHVILLTPSLRAPPAA